MAAAAAHAARKKHDAASGGGGGATVYPAGDKSPTRKNDGPEDVLTPLGLGPGGKANFPYKDTGFWKYQLAAQKFYYRTDVQITVAVLIGLNFITNVINAQVFPPEAQKLMQRYNKDPGIGWPDTYAGNGEGVNDDNPELIMDDASTESPDKVARWADRGDGSRDGRDHYMDKIADGADSYWVVFGALGTLYNVAFLFELILNMYANWLFRFWADPWNQFDFVVVAIGMMTDAYLSGLQLGPAKLLRNMRAFRVFRLFKRIKSLNKIVVALGKALPGVMNAFLIMLLVMCIYALLAVEFWGQVGRGGYMDYVVTIPEERNDDVDKSDWSYHKTYYVTSRGGEYGNEYFGNFLRSLYTLFQVLTGESWSEAIARPLIEQNDVSAFGVGFFFVSFILVNQIVLINVVVAVLLEKMVDDEEEITDEEKEAAMAPIEPPPLSPITGQEMPASEALSLDVGAGSGSGGVVNPAVMEELKSMRTQIDLILLKMDSMASATTATPVVSEQAV